MKTETTILDLIRDNKLAEALSASKASVKENPSDIQARSILCQLFCFSGEWERADTQLETISQQDKGMQLGVGLIRQLMRGEVAREQFFSEGRTPELVEEPDEALQALLHALIALRENSNDEVKQHLATLVDKLPVVKGTVNGQEFEFARDLDDFLTGYMEILTTNGKYFLIPFSKIASLKFREPERLQDQIWRSASISVVGGMDGEVYVPTRYPKHLVPADNLDDALIMGGETDWRPAFEDGPTTGYGQKMFVLGENAYTMMELADIEIHQPGEDS